MSGWRRDDRGASGIPMTTEAFVEAHERRMEELNYPEAIRNEFRRARATWLGWASKYLK